MFRLLDLNSPRNAYMLGLALIAVLVTLQFVGMHVVTKRQEVSAIEINLSGRQRMLSQRIAWTMNRLAANPASPAEEARLRSLLGVCTDLMERSHLALTGKVLAELRAVLDAGRPCLMLDATSPLRLPLDRVDLQQPAILADFTRQAWKVADGEVSREELAELPVPLEGPLIELLDQLDRATLAAQEASIAQLKKLLSLNWALILILVVGEVLLIFRPMASAVERTLSRLRDANKRLRLSETRLQDFASTAAHQFWETDDEHRFVSIGASDPNARLHSVSSSLKRRFWELDGVLTDEPGVDWDAHRATLDARLPFNGFEYAVEGADGHKAWWRVHGRPVYAEDGRFHGYRGTSLEITSEREAEEKMRTSQRMQAIGQLTAGVAHDFNNILAVIQGNADLIPGETSKADREGFVRAISDAASRGASLTHRLLAYGRVQRLHAEPVDLADFIGELQTLLARTLGENFTVQATLPSEQLHVYVDRHQLEDACLNIALNARDAASESGKLELSATVADRAKVAAMANTDVELRDYVCISFCDNGSGMPQSVQDRIFDPFFTTKTVGRGTGLGLSMVYGFVLQSNGFVDVCSAPGDGTTVSLYLPQTTRKSSARPAAALSELDFAENRSALLVEDNDALRTVMRRHLETLGFTVVEAGDGGSALERLEHEEHFDVLLLDIVLPGGIDGIEIFRRARLKDPDVKVLFCSGFTGMNDQNQSPENVPGPVLRKPFNVDQLVSALAEVLTEAAAFQSTGS